MSNPTPEEIASARKVLFEAGLQVRREVMSDVYVDRALQNNASDFSFPMQQVATEAAWGSVWTRPGLDRKQRSLLNIGMLCALNRNTELGGHIRGAIRNGLTPVEIREAIVQVSMYVGMPAGLESTRVAEKVINEMVEKGEYIMPK